MNPAGDTIVAVATPVGRGGIGVVRISGPLAESIAVAVTGSLPTPRYAVYCAFRDADGAAIDVGLALYFPAPHSFTGEDVLELQGHGGPVVMNLLVERVLGLGARPARPGEFSERAFLNDKIDLSQAEAIADLIDSASSEAARNAVRSLEGAFSEAVHDLTEGVIQIRIYVEAAMDFPEEEIDFLGDERVGRELDSLRERFKRVIAGATQGALLREGVNIVFAGRPNAGKSSLMNRVTGRDTSIVTAIPGTTRDIVNEHIHIDGIPVRLVDTAGLRDSTDPIEREGVRRAENEIARADLIVIVVALTGHVDKPIGSGLHEAQDIRRSLPDDSRCLLVLNKADLVSQPFAGLPPGACVVSALTGEGIDHLKDRIKTEIGFQSGQEGKFSARSRHVKALQDAERHLEQGFSRYREDHSGELLAEDLRYCQQSLGEITGVFTSDDLLGRIFSSFCIGK